MQHFPWDALGTGEVIALFCWTGGSPSITLALLSGSLCSTTMATPVDSPFPGAPFASPAGVSNNDCMVGAGAVAFCPFLPVHAFVRPHLIGNCRQRQAQDLDLNSYPTSIDRAGGWNG